MHLIDARLSTKEKKTWYKICQGSPHGAGIHVQVGLEGKYWVKEESGMYRQDCPTVLIPFESFLGPSKVSSRLLNFIQSLLNRRQVIQDIAIHVRTTTEVSLVSKDELEVLNLDPSDLEIFGL
jgi:hypothetical protein